MQAILKEVALRALVSAIATAIGTGIGIYLRNSGEALFKEMADTAAQTDQAATDAAQAAAK